LQVLAAGGVIFGRGRGAASLHQLNCSVRNHSASSANTVSVQLDDAWRSRANPKAGVHVGAERATSRKATSPCSRAHRIEPDCLRGEPGPSRLHMHRAARSLTPSHVARKDFWGSCPA
jgi:hypothetical protein